MQWQPIESAPKDGSAVLLCDFSEGTYRTTEYPSVVVGWWDDGEWRDMGDIGCCGQYNYDPTHWMPLPEPPAALGTVGGE
jgi:hypothetical protein